MNGLRILNVLDVGLGGFFTLAVNITYMLYFSYEVVYYVKYTGECPVEAYLSLLSEKERIKVKAHIAYLRNSRGAIGAPYSKHINGKIWELRIRFSGNNHRILYFLAPGRKIVLLSAFMKKTNKTPRSGISRANKYYFDFINRI